MGRLSKPAQLHYKNLPFLLKAVLIIWAAFHFDQDDNERILQLSSYNK